MHGSLLKVKLVDKVIAFVAPKIVGGDTAKRPIYGWSINSMTKAMTLEDLKIRHFGEDICLEGYVPELFRHLKPLGSGVPIRQPKNVRKKLAGQNQ